jgi:hypothetical protein
MQMLNDKKTGNINYDASISKLTKQIELYGK